METIWIVIFAVLGTVVASFLNVCIDRLPGKQSLIFPASHCGSCHRRLAKRDLIPIFSYLWLRGRCRYCQAPIPQRNLWVEIGLGALFAFLFWRYGLTAELAIIAVYCSVLTVIMVIDLELGIIPNRIVYPGMALVLIISLFLPPSAVTSLTGTAASVFQNALPQAGFVQAIIGGGIGLIVFLLIVIISRGGMGWGDVKLAAFIGLMTGYLIFVATLLAVILGGLVAAILLLSRRRKRRQRIPFGPFLALAAMATLLFGSTILNWYLGLFYTLP